MLPDTEFLPTIPTERLQLRWLTPGDVPALAAIFGDSEVCRYWSRPALRDLAAAEALHHEIVSCFTARSLFQWGIDRRGVASLARLRIRGARPASPGS